MMQMTLARVEFVFAAVFLAVGGAFGLDLTSSRYVASGLVGHWDGLENAGRGLHVDATNAWVDLSGVSGDFRIHPAVAAFTASGLKKNAKGVAASNLVVRTDVRTIEVVVSGAPASGWVNALFLRRAQTVTFNNSLASAEGKRNYFFDNSNYGWTTDSKPAQETVCVFYDLVANWQQAIAVGFLQNGVRPTGSVLANYWSEADPNGMYIGGRSGWPEGGDAKTTGYTIHAIRLYNRKLTVAEANFNAAVDRVRFFGASADELPYVFQNGEPMQRMSARADLGGSVLLGWVTDASVGNPRVDTEWLSLSESPVRVFRAAPLPGWRFAGWDEVASDMVMPSAEPTVLILSPLRPLEVRAHFERDTAFAGYVTNGLVCRLDGLENAGAGLHDATTNVWKDLAETSGDFHVVTGVARFVDATLRKDAKGLMATNAVRRTDALTLESVVADAQNVSGWVNAFFLDGDRTLTFNNNFNLSGERRYFVDNRHLGWKTDERPMPFTLAATYSRTSGTTQGEALYVNGAVPVRGSAFAEYWGVNDAVGMSIGGRTGASNSDYGDAKLVGYAISAARLYNRPLTAGEAAYNAALDQVRFFRASTNAMPYRLTAEGRIACVLRAWTAGLGGRVSLVGTGAPDVCVEHAWRDFGTEDAATFTAVPEDGWAFVCWRGGAETIVAGTTNSTTVSVSSTRGVALEAVFTSTGKYVRNGLIGFWDAIENVGYGRHEVMPRVWTDLSGKTGDFLLNPRPGDFAADALLRVREGRSARRGRRAGIRTIEAVVSGLQHNNKWVMPVFVGIDQHLSFRDTSATGVRQFFFDYNKMGLATTEMPTNMTLAVTFRSNTESDACYVNGVQATGESYSNYWNGVDETQMVMGARDDNMAEAGTFGYRIHAVRFYDRELTDAEIQRNAYLDAVRFFGAPRRGGTLVIVR